MLDDRQALNFPGTDPFPFTRPLPNPNFDRVNDHDDITAMIRKVEAGDRDATAELWAYCFPRLLVHCRRKLPDHLRRVLDEEDAALSAFKSFCLGAHVGKFGEIKGRDELWKLLFTIAGRKAGGYVRHQTRQKRGGGLVAGESTFQRGDQSSTGSGTSGTQSTGSGIEQVPDQVHSPASIAAFANDCQVLMDILDDDNLRTIAILRIEGHSVDEIAGRIGCAKRTVERRLNLIREIWQSKFDDDADASTGDADRS